MEIELQKKEKNKTPLSFLLDESYCVLLVKNPEEVYMFWRFSSYKIKSFLDGEYSALLRIRISDPSGKNFVELSAPWDKGSEYISVPVNDVYCQAHIFAIKNGVEEKICSSPKIKIPAYLPAQSLGSMEYGI